MQAQNKLKSLKARQAEAVRVDPALDAKVQRLRDLIQAHREYMMD